MLAPLAVAASLALAQAPLEGRVGDAEAARRRSLGQAPVQPEAAAPPGGFRFVGLFQSRAVMNNLASTNPFLDGQVVGTLGGTNETVVLTDRGLDLDGDGEPDDDVVGSRYFEQRATGFFTYAPTQFDGRVGMTAAFEVDFLYGDRSYGTGGNTGGGVGADQVNLQTRRMHGTFKPNLGDRNRLVIHAGLQFVGDSVTDPTTSTLDDLVRSGAGLRVFGTEMAGVMAYGTVLDPAGERMRYRIGTAKLYENGVAQRDDALMYVLDLDIIPDYRAHVGIHTWVLRDYSGGSGGALGIGPTSQLSALQGGPSLDLRTGPDDVVESDADLYWLAVDAGWNHRLDKGPLGATALAAWNLGKLYVLDQEDILVRGWLVDGEVRVRYAPGAGSVVRLEGLAASRDGTGRDQFTGIITANSYGIVGAVYASHGMLLLFQDPGAINRSTPVVFDVSNNGDGLIAATGGVGYDLIPNRLTATVSAGHARDQLGAGLGTELNGRLSWQPVFGTSLGVAAATLQGSAFNADPWQAMISLESLLF